MARAVLLGTAHVEDVGLTPLPHRLGLGRGDLGHGLELALGVPLEGGDVPRDVVEPDADQVAGQGLEQLRGGEEDEGFVVGEEPAGPGGEVPPGGDVDGPVEVPAGEGVLVAGVHQNRAFSEGLAELGGGEARGVGDAAQQRRAVAVEALHLGEVAGGFGLVLEQRPDEPFLVVFLEVRGPPGEAALVPNGGAGEGAEGFAAGGAGAVAGPDLHVVGEGEELGLEAVEHAARARLGGSLDAGGFLEEVGAAHIAHEDEVAGEEEHGLVRGGAVGDEEGDVLGGVAGGVDHPDADVADADLVAVLDEDVLEAVQVLVLPVLVAFVGEVEGGAGGFGELAGAGEVVGVDVGFGDGNDA